MQKQSEGAAAVRVVTEQALIRRINRMVADKCEKLHKARPWQVEELGQFYIAYLGSANVDSCGNLKASWSMSGVTGLEVDLEEYGREVGALAEWETAGVR
jgi:hypothetical protein